MTCLTAFFGGTLFGLGLIVAGMNDPLKVLAFLDVAGRWDPSLSLVMLGAISTAAAGFAFAARRRCTLLGEALQLPDRRQVDAPLLAGSVLFGVGWGLAGYCPGPAIVRGRVSSACGPARCLRRSSSLPCCSGSRRTPGTSSRAGRPRSARWLPIAEHNRRPERRTADARQWAAAEMFDRSASANIAVDGRRHQRFKSKNPRGRRGDLLPDAPHYRLAS